MTEMNQHFKLTKQEFYESSSLFNTLEIIEEQVVDQNYQYLSEYLEKQYQNLAIENYSQNDPERSRCDEIYKSYQNLKKYIEPLKSGNPCVPVSIDDESNGHLSEREFHYRNKLFAQFNITKEEVVQKTYSDIFNVLSSKQYEKKPDHLNMTQLENRVNFYTESAYYYLQLLNYIAPLQNKRNLILADKEALSMKLIKHKNNLTSKMGIPSLYNEHFLISAFFVCSLVINSIANGIILGSLLALALTTAIVAPSFFISSSIGYGIYRDSRDRVQKKN